MFGCVRIIGRKEGRKEGRNEGTKEGRKEGRRERRKERRKKGRNGGGAEWKINGEGTKPEQVVEACDAKGQDVKKGNQTAIEGGEEW